MLKQAFIADQNTGGDAALCGLSCELNGMLLTDGIDESFTQVAFAVASELVKHIKSAANKYGVALIGFKGLAQAIVRPAPASRAFDLRNAGKDAHVDISQVFAAQVIPAGTGYQSIPCFVKALFLGEAARGLRLALELECQVS